MTGRHSKVMDALRNAILETPGELDRETRDAVLTGAGPPGLQPYLDKVRRHAYKVVDGDVGALKQAGWSEDALFEATVAAAVGEGLRRLELGLASLRLVATTAKPAIATERPGRASPGAAGHQ